MSQPVQDVFDLSALVVEVGREAGRRARKNGRFFVFVRDGDGPVMVRGDHGRIRRILEDLIAQAFVDLDAEAVRCEAVVRPADPDGDVLALRFSDALADPRHLTWPVPATETRVTPFGEAVDTGGLGSPACRLAEALAVRLEKFRDAEGGAVHVFRFARQAAAATDDVPAADEIPPGLRVLLVEDNPVNRKLAVRCLENEGCIVDTAENGQEGVHKFSAGGYVAVFMDCQMPVMDGFQATHAIRLVEGGRTHVPIIAVTANAIDGDRELCLAAGMDDYIAKPLRPRDFHDALCRWCGAAELQPA